MTKQELDHHCKLQQQLAGELELLDSLEASAGPVNLEAEIADMRETVAMHKANISSSEKAIKTYIGAIQDSQTRMVFQLRFVKGMSWKEVAAALGGGNTEAGVKAMCYRHISRE